MGQTWQDQIGKKMVVGTRYGSLFHRIFQKLLISFTYEFHIEQSLAFTQNDVQKQETSREQQFSGLLIKETYLSVLFW